MPKASEKWKHKKIQGVGHDGEKSSKEKLLSKLTTLLNSGDVWIEASDSLAAVLVKRGAYIEKDQVLLKEIFPSITKFHSNGSYDRKIDGQAHTEYVFGKMK